MDATPLRQRFGWPLFMLPRTRHSRFLFDSACSRGSQVHLGEKVVDVGEHGERVSASLEDSTKGEADLLVGRDVLRSVAVREGGAELYGSCAGKPMSGSDCLNAMNTESRSAASAQRRMCTVLARLSPTSASVTEHTSSALPSAISRWFGCPQSLHRARHARTGGVWTETRRGTGSRTFKSQDGTMAPRRWVGGVTFLTNYGLHDRPILDVWHKGRVVLLG